MSAKRKFKFSARTTGDKGGKKGKKYVLEPSSGGTEYEKRTTEQNSVLSLRGTCKHLSPPALLFLCPQLHTRAAVIALIVPFLLAQLVILLITLLFPEFMYDVVALWLIKRIVKNKSCSSTETIPSARVYRNVGHGRWARMRRGERS